LLEDVTHPFSLVPYITLDGIAAMERAGKINGGMRPKLAAVKRALDGAVTSAHLVSGVQPDALLTEVFTNQGSGTMITAQAPRATEHAA
ncbi:MAG: acetylglutamate kinase, partial [Gammaproteobacteria bacterium]